MIVKKIFVSMILIIAMLLTAIGAVACDQGGTNDSSNGKDKNETGKSYTVTFETNGGSSVSEKTVSELSTAPTTTKTGHVFEGWCSDVELTTAVTFPLKLEKDVTLYARWLKIKDTRNLREASIKNWSGSYPGVSWAITPPSFDFDELEKKEYTTMKITVAFDVWYRKDYNSIGYAGGPKYDWEIELSTGAGTGREDLSAPKSASSKTAVYTTSLSEFKNATAKFSVSTANIQNTVYFDNIVVTYECLK